MKTILKKTAGLAVMVVMAHVCHGQSPKYYLANWDSLRHYSVPEWYQDAKLGIWTHWGVYSVPAYRGTHAAEWYPRWMYLVKDEDTPFSAYEQQGAAIAEHHLETYGNPSEFGYHDFIPMFKAEKWDPDAWAQLGIDSGARFFTITGMHHDGFAMYDSEYTPWNAMDMGPRRDLAGDLARAVRKKGLRFGISNHFAHNRNYYQYYFNNGFAEAYEDRPELASLYSSGKLDKECIERWWNITTEMARKYDPDLYYFDWGWNPSFWNNERPEFCAFFYNQAIRNGKGTYGNPDVVINYKSSSIAEGCAVLDLERASKGTVQDYVWQTDTSISDHSWGYSAEDTFKSPKELICMLVDIVSKNGIMMLNFGPKADGTVPEECRVPLLEMGKWLRANGEAVYATRPWIVAGEGPVDSGKPKAGDFYTAKDIRYTRSKDGKTLYATAFGFPEGALTLRLTTVVVLSDDATVVMLANGKSIPFALSDRKQLVLDLTGLAPENAGCDYAYSFRIEGMKIEGTELEPIDLSEIYMHDAPDHDPLPGTFTSQYPYLSAVKPVYEKAHNGVKRDTNYHGRTIVVGGKEYEHGLMVCPSGDGNRGLFIVKTEAMPSTGSFAAEIGIDDAMATAGNSAFIVEAYLDNTWERLYESRVLTYEDKPVKIDVRIPAGAEFIRFVTTDGGNGCAADHAVWADAKFLE